MAKRMKVYLPRWVLWVILPILFLVWGLVTYLSFGTASGRQEMGTTGWLILTAVIALVGVMLWLMGSQRLPAYIIEVEDGEDEKRS